MKPDWKVVFLILIGIAVIRIFYLNPVSKTPGEKSVGLNKAITEVASEMNKGLPKMMNNYLRIDSVNAGNMILITHYTAVNQRVSDFKEGYKARFMEMFKEMACNPAASPFFELGISASYSIHDKDSALIGTFVISPEDCK